MPLTRAYSFTALDNPDYAPLALAPVPSSVSCHSQMPAGSLPCDTIPSESFLTTVGKSFIKPPTIPFDQISFIHEPFLTTVGKPFVKPPTMPFHRMSFIRQSSPLAPSHNFPTLSVFPPPKLLTPSKPKLNLYRKTLIFYWGRRSPAHQEFSKKCAAKGRVSKKRTPKKCVTSVANLPVERSLCWALSDEYYTTIPPSSASSALCKCWHWCAHPSSCKVLLTLPP